jgi:Na+/melibiose symporter-like transporter
VFWWFIKMGTAFASLVMGALLVHTSFDERQNVLVDALGGTIAMLGAEAEAWSVSGSAQVERDAAVVARADTIVASAGRLRSHLERRLTTHPAQAEHTRALLAHLGFVEKLASDARELGDAGDAAQLRHAAVELLRQSAFLRRQSPDTLFRLRLMEIGLPLALSVVTILLVLRYPLTEQRCYEIKELLKQRRGPLPTAS